MINKFKKVMVLAYVFVLISYTQSFAQTPFPRIMSLERIEKQLSSPAPKLLPVTPENYGANIVGLISWSHAKEALEYAKRNPSPIDTVDKAMIAIVEDILEKENNFREDINRAIKYYRSKDAENLNKMLNTMLSDRNKFSRYPYTADMFTNMVYNADLDEALTPYRAMLHDIENDSKRMHQYLLDAKYDREKLWECF